MVRGRRVSRTAQPHGGPYSWVDHVAADGERIVENELDDCLQSGCRTQSDYDMCVEEVAARRRRAAAGLLVSPDQATSVRSQPLLWEIRWDFKGRLLRMYHAEPSKARSVLLALKYHWKDTSGSTQDTVDQAQDSEMAEAAKRYRTSPLHPGPGLDD